MKNYIKNLVLLSLLTTCVAYGQKTNAPAFGKGLFNLVGQDSSWTMNMSARMQFLGVMNINIPKNGIKNSVTTNFQIRRARLKFSGFAFSPKLKYKLELGLSNRDISGASSYTSNTPRYIFDAIVMWNFYKNFVLWVGQTKLPGNIERVISSGNLQMVDRSLVNSRFNIDRDQGLQLRHHTTIGKQVLFRTILALSQGEGRNITTGNIGGYEYTGRIELLPFGSFQSGGDYSGSDLKRESDPKLLLAATYDLNENAVKNRSNQGSYMTNDNGFFKTDIRTVFLDAMFKYQGYSCMIEYAHRSAADPIAKNSDNTVTGDIVQIGSGINIQMGYLFKNNIELSGRFTRISLDKGITKKLPETQYTGGLSKYFVGHKLKIQSDISYTTIEQGDDDLMMRLQLDVHF